MIVLWVVSAVVIGILFADKIAIGLLTLAVVNLGLAAMLLGGGPPGMGVFFGVLFFVFALISFFVTVGIRRVVFSPRGEDAGRREAE